MVEPVTPPKIAALSCFIHVGLKPRNYVGFRRAKKNSTANTRPISPLRLADVYLATVLTDGVHIIIGTDKFGIRVIL